MRVNIQRDSILSYLAISNKGPATQGNYKKLAMTWKRGMSAAEGEIGIRKPPYSKWMPEELMEFIWRDTYSLLVKGHAGTGKTTLALSILRTLDIRRNFFYISTRISPKQLFQYYPWLPGFMDVSTLSIGQPATPAFDSVGGSPIERMQEPGSAGSELQSFEDARLDEPESLFERITNQLMDIKSPIIIIDSWDAIASFMDKEARLNNERVLQTWRERAGAKLIFISEHPEDTTLDFLVDGVVELKQRYFESIRLREIFLLKLRGVRIDKASYFFTLNDGSFKSFVPYGPWNVASSVEPKGKPATKSDMEISSPDLVRTGYPALDDALGGGYPARGNVLIELDPHADSRVVIAFLGRIVRNFVSSGNGVFIRPSDLVDPQQLIRFLMPHIPSGPKKDLFRIIMPLEMLHNLEKAKPPRPSGATKAKGVIDYLIMPKRGITPEQLFAESIDKWKQHHPNRLVLGIVAPSTFRSENNPVKGKQGSDHESYDQVYGKKNNGFRGDLSLTITRHSNPLLQYLIECNDVHLKLTIISGTLFLQPIKPSSSLFAIEFAKSPEGQDEVRLEPMV